MIVPSGVNPLPASRLPVPEVLASHLQNDGGAIVVNIARNSPADKAGLKRYDVILRINDKRIEAGDEKSFMDRIRGLKSGDRLDVLLGVERVRR